ncbi:MAG: PEGA domain-containing protein [bacterium]
METTTMDMPQTGRLAIRSAGRTLKGSAHPVSGEFICCVNYSGPGRVRGLYGIAEGVAGEQGLASELAIETLKKSFRQIRESDSVNGSNLLPGCLEEIHSAFINKNAGEDQEKIEAALVCGYIEGNTVHIALAGGGAAYILENGRISRITQDANSPDLENTDPTLLLPGQTPAGYSKTDFKPVFLSHTLKSDSVVIFCSDGLLARLNSLTIQEKITSANSLDDAADLIVNEAHKHDSAGDVAVVLARLEPPAEHKKNEFSSSIKYPLGVFFLKYLTVSLLAAALAFLIFFGTKNITDGKKSAEQAGGIAAPDVFDIGIGQNKPSASEKPLLPTAQLLLQTEPENARVFINGVQQPGASPFTLSVTAGGGNELRVEAAGYEPFEEKLNLDKDTSIQRIISLRHIKAKNGSLIVSCQPSCDKMEFDGHSIGGFPRNEIVIREIMPGDHRLKAHLNGETEGRNIRIVSGITQSIVVRFAGEKINQQTQLPAGVNFIKPGAPQESQSAVEVVRTRPESDKRELEQIKKLPDSNAPIQSSPALDSAFFIIDTNVTDCSVMILKNNRLMMTGFSGTRYDLKPGRYTIQVSKPGYEEVQRDALLDKEFQVIHFQLKKQQD